MFTWICPTCGRENPPSYTECPNCAERLKQAGAPPAAAEAVAPPPQQAHAAAPPPYIPPAPPVYAPAPPPPPSQTYYQPPQPPKAAGLPTWLMGVLFALAFLGLGAIVYYAVQRFSPSARAERIGVENPANPSRAKVTNPLQKYVEVVGIRLVQNSRKKIEAKFIVVNHGSVEIADLAANVTLWASTSRSEEDSVGTFSFKIPSLGPGESKDESAPLTTKLKIYELPDWQNTTAELQITSPQ